MSELVRPVRWPHLSVFAGGFETAPADEANRGEVPEWTKGADCKSAADRLRRFESSPLHHQLQDSGAKESFFAGIAQLARARAFQARGRGFESRFPLHSIVRGKRRARRQQPAATVFRHVAPCPGSSVGRARPW